MKTIRILIPTFNEEKNVEPLADAIIKHFAAELPQYDYFINFIDNKSTDQTRAVIRQMAAKNKRIKAIFNAKNFGQFNSPYYGLLCNDFAPSDCTVLMCADFQDPVEMISKFVREWEQGHRVVVGVKTKTKENRFIRMLRTVYYKLIKRMSAVKQIEHFTGFALYDNSFIETLKQVKDPSPFLRGLVAELCGDYVTIEYTQAKRRAGKTKNNFRTLYDAAMLSITTYTKKIPRAATIFGAFACGVSFLGIIAMCISAFFVFISPVYFALAGLGFFGFVNLFFIGILGEYIVNMNVRMLNRPLVIEEERING